MPSNWVRGAASPSGFFRWSKCDSRACWGVELSSRGGWLSFALIWTQAGGGWKAAERVGWLEKGKPAQHHHNGSLASLCCIIDSLSSPLTVYFTYQHRIQLFWSASRALNALYTLKNSSALRTRTSSTAHF